LTADCARANSTNDGGPDPPQFQSSSYRLTSRGACAVLVKLAYYKENSTLNKTRVEMYTPM